MMPVNYSPDVVFVNGLKEWTCSDKKTVAQGLTRLVSAVAFPIITLLGALYNAVAFAIKVPLTLIRYTIGFIPTKEGRVADLLPEDTTMKHMMWHVYRIVFTSANIVVFHPLLLLNPEVGIAYHEVLGLVPREDSFVRQRKREDGEASVVSPQSNSIPPQQSHSIPPPPNPENFKTFKLKTWKEKQAEAANGRASPVQEKKTEVKPKKDHPKGFGGFDPTASPLFAKAKANLV
ncbi:hypothetical protein [Estrella lausannensis]|nr:hypothetical protein [Estrella lausannensis]